MPRPSKRSKDPLPESEKPIGLLAFQGAYAAHGRACESLGYRTLEVRTNDDLDRCSHLILPGGESTTFLKLLDYTGMDVALREWARRGKPIFCTCAGLILLAREVLNPPQASLGIYDVVVERNAYGRQVDSFETDIEIQALGPEPFHAIFIRSPIILSVGKGVKVLASHTGHPVFIRQGNLFATTFHPELTEDTRIHALFLSAREGLQKR